MIYNSVCVLGWICTMQILHNLSQRTMDPKPMPPPMFTHRVRDLIADSPVAGAPSAFNLEATVIIEPTLPPFSYSPKKLSLE